MRTLTSLLIALAAAVYAQSYAIKGPESPKPYEANAMRELGDYLAKRIDGKLTIGGKSPIVFHVGDTSFAKEQGCLSAQLQEEQWIIKSFDNDVILNGGGTRGALYAVYHFLEDYCDIHWWNEYEEYVPKASALYLPELDAAGKPAFIYRDIYCYHISDNTHPGYVPFAIRNRRNRAGDRPVPPEFGGAFDYGPPYHCHTFFRYIPEATYFKEHPEFFALVGGKRVPGDRSQLCLTNPELKQLFLNKLLKAIADGKADAAKRNLPAARIYDISMNDVRRMFCQCPECKAEIDKYGASGHLLRFVNWLAERAGKEHPELLFSTLAYFDTDVPPKGGVRANDNVVVKLCDTTTNQAASILEPENSLFKEFVSTWKNYAKNLFIWDYSVVYPNSICTMLPYASEFHYGSLLNYYLANNVTGVFWEHEYADKADMYELKCFMEAKLMEEPSRDANELLELFMTRFYGAAGKHILQYRTKLDEARKLKKGRITWSAKYSSFNYIEKALLKECHDIFEQAEMAVKDDPVSLHHVRRARMGLDYITAHRSLPIFQHGLNLHPAVFDTPSDVIAKRFLNTYDAWADRFPNADSLKKSIRSMTNFNSVGRNAAPVPKELEGRAFIDFYPMHFDNQSGWHGNRIVSDSESLVGEAMRVDVQSSKKYDGPFEIGVYDLKNSKNLGMKVFKTLPEGEGYHWYKLPAIRMPFDGYVYVTPAWTIQLPMLTTEISGKPFEVWVSAKHVGPRYHPDQQLPNYIYIDRIVFVH